MKSSQVLNRALELAFQNKESLEVLLEKTLNPSVSFHPSVACLSESPHSQVPNAQNVPPTPPPPLFPPSPSPIYRLYPIPSPILFLLHICRFVTSISDALTKLPSSLPLEDHFSLHFSHVNFNTQLLSLVLDSSPSAGRLALDLYRYLVRRSSFTPSDLSLSLLIHYLGRRHDFKAISSLLSHYPRVIGPHSISATIDRLVRAGRPSQAISCFESLEQKSLSNLKILVSSLSEHKYASYAERTVKKWAAEIFPDQELCNLLIKAWCNDQKLDEARMLVGEILRGGFEVGTPAYNAILDCICRLCRKKDPVMMKAEAERFMDETEVSNIPRDVETFRVFIYNLCKVRKTEDALALFRRMGEWNCSPDAETFLVLIRSLYQAARVSEGDEVIGSMRLAGFGYALDRKAYYGFVKILCGIERVEHAMKVFRMMKGYWHVPGIKTYDLLIGKLAEHNQVDRAKSLFKEAVARGVPVMPKVYKLNPRYVKKKEKREKKRETLPEKMKKKRRRLKRLRLSFVRKPKSSMRRFI